MKGVGECGSTAELDSLRDKRSRVGGRGRVTIDSLDELLFLFGTSLWFHVQF